MKQRLLLPIPTLLIVATLLVAIAGCISESTTSSSWTHQQRKAMRRTLMQYRDMVYIDEMTDAEFIIFTNNVTDEIEAVHPLYTSVIDLPAVSDTIDMYITTTIVEQLDADGANIRHIYPYRELRKEGILPSGLSQKEQRSFYKCLARKVNDKYDNFSQFFQAVISNTTPTSEIATMEAECAKALFNYTPSTK